VTVENGTAYFHRGDRQARIGRAFSRIAELLRWRHRPISLSEHTDKQRLDAIENALAVIPRAGTFTVDIFLGDAPAQVHIAQFQSNPLQSLSEFGKDDGHQQIALGMHVAKGGRDEY
jgi:hypothetical protein